jgi:hypothetical protein
LASQDELRTTCPEYSEEVLARGLTQNEIAAIYATVMSASTLEMTKGWDHMIILGTWQGSKLNKFARNI